jgi:hypothetical protein
VKRKEAKKRKKWERMDVAVQVIFFRTGGAGEGGKERWVCNEVKVYKEKKVYAAIICKEKRKKKCPEPL